MKGIAKRQHAAQISTRDLRDERRRTGRNDELVVSRFAVARTDRFGAAVDTGNGLAEAAVDTARRIPAGVVQYGLLIGLLAREHRGKHNPIVVATRFGAEQRHGIALGRQREQMFEQAA
jgi:hypothetical protein